MSLRNRLGEEAVRFGERARVATSEHLQRGGEGLRGFRAVVADEDRRLSVEDYLSALVRAVRQDEREEDRTRRDVYVEARKRRRRLGLVSLGAGPLAGVVSRAIDLYCEAGIVCDLAELHELDLTDQQIAAHLLVLWSVSDDLSAAERALRGDPPVADLLRTSLDRLGLELPQDLTKVTVTKALWDLQKLDLPAAVTKSRKKVAGQPISSVAFAGHRTKRVIKKVERQLQEPTLDHPPPKKGTPLLESNYLNLFLDAEIGSSADHDRYSRCLDAVLAKEAISIEDIVGLGENGTGSNRDLYVVHREAVTVARERGLFNKRVECQRLCATASLERLRATAEGFKGTDLTITGHDARGEVVLKILWGLGGPDWVEPLVLSQRERLFNLISQAMDEAPARQIGNG